MKASLTQQSWERWSSGKQKQDSSSPHDQAPQDGEMADQPKDFATRAERHTEQVQPQEGQRKPQESLVGLMESISLPVRQVQTAAVMAHLKCKRQQLMNLGDRKNQ